MIAQNLYEFWGSQLADALSPAEKILNLTSVEYGKTITKYIEADPIVTPQFLTVSSKTGEPTFVTVHTKIARGAFASWCIKNRIDQPEKFADFHDLGYTYNEIRSTSTQPVFVCQKFEGLGLSIRLSATM